MRARDWAALRALVADDFRFEDRGKPALVSGDVDTWIASMQFTTGLPELRPDAPEIIATLGDGIALDHFAAARGRG